ncbi:hypothetical protein [Sphingorhabdus sp. 109]|jgi:hypothetical protein|uniref:hypothetical protein n=1 Tax=Sphingorhabdus sp. 109 TaxID=2653173 RepID=UPI0012EF02D3|nr:hypothetical protein [Sphingorhabdus sp. 109]VWX57317.1 conserved hypothetical protein [Sphingorhabdus sp. 109]
MANPFGIEAGSTVPSGMATYHVILHSVPKPHPAFKTYSGIWKPEAGLVRILGQSETFTDDSYASNALRIYDQVKRQLSQIYGPPKVDEDVIDDTWSDPKDFCMALENGGRNHACRWMLGTHDLTDDVQHIMLMIATNDGYEMSHVMLDYEFSGCDDDNAGDAYGLDSL